jgi:hypothetical protein
VSNIVRRWSCGHNSPAVQQALRLDNLIFHSNAVAILQDLKKQTIVDDGLLTSSPSPVCSNFERFPPPLRPRLLYLWCTSPIRVVNNISVLFSQWFFMMAVSLGSRASVLKSQSNINNFNCESIDERRTLRWKILVDSRT